jgi:hypothetical protein
MLFITRQVHIHFSVIVVLMDALNIKSVQEPQILYKLNNHYIAVKVAIAKLKGTLSASLVL